MKKIRKVVFKDLETEFSVIDPLSQSKITGGASVILNGKDIGNDGINDGRLLIVNDVDLSKTDLKDLKKFVKVNSGDADAFLDNSFVYNNTTEMELSRELRDYILGRMQELDNGKGGTRDGNNQEHGGYVSEGYAYFEPSGAVVSPCDPNVEKAIISLPTGYVTFHSHPSGTCDGWGFKQSPQEDDIKYAGEYTHYVFAMEDKKVYIYNSDGTMASIPMKHFVDPKDKK